MKTNSRKLIIVLVGNLLIVLACIWAWPFLKPIMNNAEYENALAITLWTAGIISGCTAIAYLSHWCVEYLDI